MWPDGLPDASRCGRHHTRKTKGTSGKSACRGARPWVNNANLRPDLCGCGGIGRRAALRSLFFNRSESSSLFIRTNPARAFHHSPNKDAVLPDCQGWLAHFQSGTSRILCNGQQLLRCTVIKKCRHVAKVRLGREPHRRPADSAFTKAVVPFHIALFLVTGPFRAQ